MAEALAIVGLAGNVVQLVDAGWKLFSLEHITAIFPGRTTCLIVYYDGPLSSTLLITEISDAFSIIQIPVNAIEPCVVVSVPIPKSHIASVELFTCSTEGIL